MRGSYRFMDGFDGIYGITGNTLVVLLLMIILIYLWNPKLITKKSILKFWNNQKPVSKFIGIMVFVIFGYLLYQKYKTSDNQKEDK